PGRRRDRRRHAGAVLPDHLRDCPDREPAPRAGVGRAVARRLDTAFVILFGVVLAAAAIFLVVPIGMTVLMSFDGREYLGRFPPPGLSLRWYRAFFFDGDYMTALRNSVVIATAAATVATATGVTAAVLLDRYRFPGRGALSAFFLSPLVVPTVVMG